MAVANDLVRQRLGAPGDAALAAVAVTARRQIRPPKVGQAAARLLDVNRATQQQLEALPGIGPARATAILAARAQAPFATTDDLLDRGLVTPTVYAQIRDLIGVGVGER